MQSVTRGDAHVSARRRALLVIAVLVVAAGLVTHVVGRGPIADALGDALYAVMIYVVIAIVLPRAPVWIVGASAAALCMLIECFQLTGLPAIWSEAFWPVRLVLGVGFGARDLVAYAVGAGAAALCDHAIGRRLRARAQ